MKTKVKMISLVMAVIVALLIGGQCLGVSVEFSDLTNIRSKDKIIALQDKGIIKGVSAGKFDPDRAITAAEGVSLIVRAFGLNIDNMKFFKEPKATDYFPKADNNEWYAGALIIAAANGMELPKDLSPDQKWTREEFTYHLMQTMEAQYNLPMIHLIAIVIADEKDMNISYSGAIQRALYSSVTKLDDAGKFNPKAELSRAEAAEQVYNALDYINNHPTPCADSEGNQTK